MKKVLAIINPISGTGSKDSIPALLAESYQDTDIQLFITYTKEGGHAFELAEQAVAQGYEYVIAIGGDGTVNEIAKALINTNTALAIIPKGSGNGLARALGMPMGVKAAIKAILNGKEQIIDCCRANGQPFFCTCGMGFDAQVSKEFAEAPFRGPLTYFVTMVDKYIRFKPEVYRITLEDTDEVWETEAFIVAGANASQYGNNAYIAPNASMTDGKIDLIVLRPFGGLQAPQVTLQLFSKKLESSKLHESYQVSRAIIERPTAGPVHLDGEPVEMGTKLEIEVIPSSIRVISPEGAEL